MKNLDKLIYTYKHKKIMLFLANKYDCDDEDVLAYSKSIENISIEDIKQELINYIKEV